MYQKPQAVVGNTVVNDIEEQNKKNNEIERQQLMATILKIPGFLLSAIYPGVFATEAELQKVLNDMDEGELKKVKQVFGNEGIRNPIHMLNSLVSKLKDYFHTTELLKLDAANKKAVQVAREILRTMSFVNHRELFSVVGSEVQRLNNYIKANNNHAGKGVVSRNRDKLENQVISKIFGFYNELPRVLEQPSVDPALQPIRQKQPAQIASEVAVELPEYQQMQYIADFHRVEGELIDWPEKVVAIEETEELQYSHFTIEHTSVEAAVDAEIQQQIQVVFMQTMVTALQVVNVAGAITVLAAQQVIIEEHIRIQQQQAEETAYELQLVELEKLLNDARLQDEQLAEQVLQFEEYKEAAQPVVVSKLDTSNDQWIAALEQLNELEEASVLSPERIAKLRIAEKQASATDLVKEFEELAEELAKHGFFKRAVTSENKKVSNTCRQEIEADEIPLINKRLLVS